MAAPIKVPGYADRKRLYDPSPDRYTAWVERLGPRGEGGWRLKRSVLLLVAVAVALLLASGVALAKTFHCNGGLCRGTNNNDTIYGSDARDPIYSLRGADLVRGNGSADSLNGDGGRDRLSGGRGNDTVNGGDDDDLVAGNTGFDALNAGN